jgi:ubiquinone/menaquinone biosynthesis C-methylase UbiE
MNDSIKNKQPSNLEPANLPIPNPGAADVPPSTKAEVRAFYNTIGWKQVENGIYQNARYEDLRPVSQAYIQGCHQRVPQHLAESGQFLLDAGSGPIQYEVYETFSEGYRYRVCADISDTALKEARNKIGDARSGGHGLFVVADVANLPFRSEVFDGLVSMHTIHHLPLEEHSQAYGGLSRVLKSGRSGVIINGWSSSLIMDPFRALSKGRRRVYEAFKRMRAKSGAGSAKTATGDGRPKTGQNASSPVPGPQSPVNAAPKNTFVQKHNYAWFKRSIMPAHDVEVRVWRTASVHFLKNYVFEGRAGRQLLTWLFKMEERFPHFFGRNGTYPLIVMKKGVER